MIHENEDSYKLRTMARYWRAKVEREVAVGESRDRVVQWAAAAVPKERRSGLSLAGEGPIVVRPDELRVTGLDFACSAYVVQVRIDFGPDGRVMRRTVTTPAACA